MSQAAANIKTSELELQIKSRNQIIMDLSMRLSELSERMESKPSEAGGGGDGGASTAASLLAALEKHSIKKGEEPAAAGQLNVVA